MLELVHRQWSFHAQEHSDQLSELCRRCQLAIIAVQISAHFHHPVQGKRIDYICQPVLTGLACLHKRAPTGTCARSTQPAIGERASSAGLRHSHSVEQQWRYSSRPGRLQQVAFTGMGATHVLLSEQDFDPRLFSAGSMAGSATSAQRCQTHLCSGPVISQPSDCISSHSTRACTAQGTHDQTTDCHEQYHYCGHGPIQATNVINSPLPMASCFFCRQSQAAAKAYPQL